ncbi:MAG: hypothetical protein P1U56_12600 [Saprospiraceae bacterium]|nr:hypothetical protein [Saprospiraceae bacterium]
MKSKKLWKVKGSKTKKWSIYYVMLAFTITGIISFYGFDQKQADKVSDPEPTSLIPPLVQKELDKKLNRYKQTILNKCRTLAYEKAEAYIDSLVSEELKFQTRDTIKFPSQPVRPILNAPIILNDSTEISPILKKD